jgi:hypothetical protein
MDELRLFPLGRRPPPWLARPPFAAISRCFSGLIAAKPRFEPLLLVAMICSSVSTEEQRQ